MTTPDLRSFKEIVESWQTRRDTLMGTPSAKRGSAASLREFVEIHNALTRRLITVLGVHDPKFYDGLLELAQNAGRVLEGGKIFVDGQDRTDL